MKLLFDNAILSIELGVEDFETEDDRRLLSAIRNVYAGVLLLCKQVLWNASPPGSDGSLIYRHLVPIKQPDGSVVMKPKKAGRNTVDRQEIEERFSSLGINLDWTRLKQLAGIRNDAEHLHMKVSPSVAREAFASAMPLIERLLAEHLSTKATDVFDEAIWKALLQNKDVYSQLKKRCYASFENMSWPSYRIVEALDELRCDECGSSLVQQSDKSNSSLEDMQLQCAECGEELVMEDRITEALEDSTGAEAHIAIKDGGNAPTATCPECDRESWIVEDANCIFCGELDLTCSFCQETFHPDDFNYYEGQCGYCMHRMEKVMRE